QNEKAAAIQKQDEKDQRTNALNQKKDDTNATKQRVEEQKKVREKIKEQVQKELDTEKKEIRQTDQKKSDERNDRRIDEQKQQQDDEARKQNITNFAGYTNAQLQQMAQRGEISQNDYKTEIENREEKLAEKQQSLTKTDNDMAKNINRADRVERQMGEIETAFSEDSNNNINAETRNEIVQNLENPQNTQTQRDNVQREQQQRAFAQWQNDFGFLIR
ncbi:MAG: hypothetical protein J5819_04045, partial [Eubacterium sp.]|nr:hypothetical protein [Eubacterium sp.]